MIRGLFFLGVLQRAQFAQRLDQDREHARVAFALFGLLELKPHAVFDVAHLTLGRAPQTGDQ
jgi:hypothetical protein